MANDYYIPSGWPASQSKGASATAQAELSLVEDGFDKLPTITGNGDEFVAVDGSGISLTSITAAAAKTLLGLVVSTDVQAYDAELAALAGLSPSAGQIPKFTGSGTAGLFDFLDEDDMASDSATAGASQQSLKAYVDALYSANLYTLDAPANTQMLSFGPTPAGWTAQTGYNNDAISIHATTPDTGYGTNAIDSDQTSGNQSANHTHGIFGSTGTSVSPRANEMGGGSYQLSNEHFHTASYSVTSATQDTSHAHTFYAAAGVYCKVIKKT